MTLGKRTDYGDAKYAGLEVAFPDDVDRVVQDTLLGGFDFVVAPLVRPGHRPPVPGSAPSHTLLAPFSRADVLYLPSSQWTRQVVGQCSAWVDPDAAEESGAEGSELACSSVAALRAEIGWAAHLGLQAVMLPPPPHGMRCAHFSQAVNQALEGLTHMALWAVIPVDGSMTADGTAAAAASTGSAMEVEGAPTEGASSGAGAGAGGVDEFDGWEAWHTLRTLCGYDTLLGCVLRLGPQLPSPERMSRWLGEPLKAVLLPTCAFRPNKRGYPVLPPAHQELLAKLFAHNVQVILTGPPLHAPPATPPPVPLPANPTPAEAAAAGSSGQAGQHFVALDPSTGTGFVLNNPGEAHPLRPYWEYLCFVFRKLPVLSEDARTESEYRDYLQAPLQPLQDNLESGTYEVFEKDTIKYVQYEEAVYRALMDRGGAQAAKDPGFKPQQMVLMVVGAGRGPLVAASMRASARSGVPLRVYAVEKNPNAVVHIQAMLAREGWEQRVTIVSADMRHWVAPEPADILVSELLGSFGDNELSPECLDGAQRFLAPSGISIPCSYTSYLAPVTSHKLWTDARAYKDRGHMETPYVVKFHKHHLLAPTQRMFTFVHPNRAPAIDNNRYKRAVWQRPREAGSGLLHGFAGYFDTVLYADVTLSTHPPTHTPNMASWFPIYFPLQEPVYCPAGTPIEAHMWRCGAAHKVWYEWGVTSPVATPIHNVNGRSYYVGL